MKLKERLSNDSECAIAKLAERKAANKDKKLLELVQKRTRRQSRIVWVKWNHQKINQKEVGKQR